MTTRSRTGAPRCCQYRELAARLGSAPPRSVLPRSRSTVGSAPRRRFRITGSAPKYLRCRRSYTSLLLPGLTSRPTSRMILWAAHAPARRGPRRGVLAAAPDSKSRASLRLANGRWLILLLLQSGGVRRLYSTGRGRCGVLMCPALNSWRSAYDWIMMLAS